MKEWVGYWFSFVLTYRNWFELLLCRVSGKGAIRVVLRNGLVINGKNNSPLSVIADEIFVLKRYTPRNFEIKKGDIVVDIGAHVGVFSLMAASSGASSVFSYEPDPESAAMIKKNARINRLRNIWVKNVAISDKRGVIKLFLDREDGRNSIIAGNKNRPIRLVKSIKLEDIFQTARIGKIDFLKIDCEGAEGLILRSPPARIWEKIDRISMEYHDGASPMSHKEMEEYLRKQGYLTTTISYGGGLGYIYARKAD